jgi:hypothetical protein
MSISCGHCKGTHESIAQARLCSRRPTQPQATPRRATFAELAGKLDFPKSGLLRFALPNQDKTHRPFLFQARQGRKPGVVFINRVTEHGGTKLDLDSTQQYWALAHLAADQVTAEVRYARATEHCSRCGKFLSDTSSVACGYGPDCYELKFGVKQPKVKAA